MSTSPNDTVVKGTAGSITDAHGNVWRIDKAGQVVVDGKVDKTTSAVQELAYVNGTVYQENINFDWWGKVNPGDAWSPANGSPYSPLPYTTSRNGALIAVGQGGSLTDQYGNVWTIDTASGSPEVAVNGIVDPTTSDVMELVYNSGTIYQDAQSTWSEKSSYTAPWTPTTNPGVFAGTYAWASAHNGSWNTASNWSPSGGPMLDAYDGNVYSADTVVFDTGATNRYVVSGIGNANTIDISSDRVTFNAFTENDSGAPRVSFNVSNGAAVTISANSSVSVELDMGEPGAVSIDNARLTVLGTIQGGQFTINSGGTLTASGANARIIAQPVHDATSDISSAGVINLANGAVMNVEGGLGGTVRISGANTTLVGVSEGGPDILDGRILGSNGGTLAYSAPNNGMIIATAGRFDVTGAISYSSLYGTVDTTGGFQVDPGATLELGAGSNENVSFLNDATLLIDQGIIETGFLEGFRAGDAVDLQHQNSTSVSAAPDGSGNTIVSLYSGSSVADVLNFAGSYSADNFSLQPDSAGSGTVLAYQPPGSGAALPINSLEGGQQG